MLLLGILASADVNPLIASSFQKNGAGVSLAGGTSQFINQVIGIGVTFLLGSVVTFILLMVIRAVLGLRVDAEAEQSGLDVSQNGENANNE
jgi:Amt family ammonium transporter